jgi:hypothetical protein
MGCPSTSPKRYEAETNCVKEHDLGQVASEGVYNAGYYSKTGAYAARFYSACHVFLRHHHHHSWQPELNGVLSYPAPNRPYR